MQYLAIVLTLGATFCWAFAQVIGKIALRDMSSLTFNTIRFSFVAVILFVGLSSFSSIEIMAFEPPFYAAVLSGLFGWFVATLLYFYVLGRGSAHKVIPAGNSYPFWAIIMAFLFLPEEITAAIPFSAGLIFAGTYLLSGRESGDQESWKYGVPVASFVAFLWGLNAVFNKFALNEGMELFSLLFVRISSAAVIFLIVSGARSIRTTPNFSKKSFGISILSGLISFMGGSFLYLSALTLEAASKLAPITGSTVLFGFLLSVVILEERPTKRAFLGAIAIFGGILIMIL